MTERSEDSEFWRAHRKRERRANEKRRIGAEGDFGGLQSLTMQKGFALKKHTFEHYQLAYGRENWLWNIYPGNKRIYVDEAHRAVTPRLDLPAGWTLADVVRAAIALREEVRGR